MTDVARFATYLYSDWQAICAVQSVPSWGEVDRNQIERRCSLGSGVDAINGRDESEARRTRRSQVRGVLALIGSF